MAKQVAKRTYTVSLETAKRFEELVPAGERSRIVEKLIRETTDSIVRQRRRASIAEGLAYMADVGEETEQEWAPTLGEGWPKP